MCQENGFSTMDDILEVVAWSFRCLLAGKFLLTGFRGEELQGKRVKQAGLPLGCFGLISEIQGDWETYKNGFGLAGWNTGDNCCYRCWATPQDIRDVSSTASWRSKRKTLWEHSCSRFQNSLPDISLDTFVIDWLHCVDLGVASNEPSMLLYSFMLPLGFMCRST